MELNFMTIEVDGSLRNPFALAAFAIWLVVLVSFAIVFGIRAAKQTRKTKWLALLGIGLLLVPITKLAHGLIATLLYNWPDGGVASAGLWGGPPMLPGPIVAITTFLMAKKLTEWRMKTAAV
jgi:hypothetical protein